MSVGPKTSYVWLWAHQTNPNNAGTNPIFFLGKYSFWNNQILQIRYAGWKRRVGKFLRSVVKTLEHLEYETNIYHKTWKGHLLIFNLCNLNNWKFSIFNQRNPTQFRFPPKLSVNIEHYASITLCTDSDHADMLIVIVSTSCYHTDHWRPQFMQQNSWRLVDTTTTLPCLYLVGQFMVLFG